MASRPLFLTVALLLGAACGGPRGTVLLDLCTPAGAADPFEAATLVRVVTSGDVQRVSEVSLDGVPAGSTEAALPLGAQVVLSVEVLNHLGGVLASGQTDRVEVMESTELCVCLARTADAAACQGVGCRYLAAEGRCTFYDR